MAKEKVTYQEKYRKGSRMVRQALLPERLPYMQDGWRISSIEMRSAGEVEIDGKKYEFQDLHVLLEEVS